MARSKNDGLKYFPLNCDFFSNRKIRKLKNRFGNDGVAVYLYILCEVYRTKGYYMIWDEDVPYDIASDLNISHDLTEQIIAFLRSRSMLTIITADEASILATSDAAMTAYQIQEQYQESTKGLKRTVQVDVDLWLLDESETMGHIKVAQKSINPGNKSLNPGKKKVNPGNMPQRKRNEIKRKEIKDTPQPPKGEACAKSKPDRIDYQGVADYWNATCTALPKVTTLSDQRKRTIRTRINEHGKDAMKQVIDLTSQSDFLLGRTGGDWKCATFDWILKPANFVKILEGNYANRKKTINNVTNNKAMQAYLNAEFDEEGNLIE